VTEAADRYVDDFRRRGTDGRLVQPHALDNARPEVLDEHVGAVDEPHQHRLPARVLQVEGNRALVPVVVEIVRRHAAAPVGDVAGEVALEALDLDDVGPLVGEEHGGRRAGDDAGQVDDADAVQGSWHGASILTVVSLLPYRPTASNGEAHMHVGESMSNVPAAAVLGAEIRGVDLAAL